MIGSRKLRLNLGLIGSATIIFATAPSIRKAVLRTDTSQNPTATKWIIAVFSVYGGYFGAGLGQITLAGLALCDWDDLKQANALKNALISAISLVAVVIFGLSGTVHWGYALVMMVSSGVGGYLGGHLTHIVPHAVLRGGIIAFGVILTFHYF